MRARTRIFAVVRDLDAAVRGGRVAAPLKRIVDFLNLTPVLGVRRGGRFGPLGMLLGRRDIVNKTVRFILRRVDATTRYRISIAHADCEDDARRLLEGLRAGIANVDAVYFTQVGAALGTHAGPSAIAAAIQEYTPPGPPGDGT